MLTLFESPFGQDASWRELILASLQGAAAAALLVSLSFVLARRGARLPLHRLLGGLGSPRTTIGFYLRGMFVPSGEFYSRDPEYPSGSPGSVTVRKWLGIPEVYPAGDARAAADLLYLLARAGSADAVVFRSIEKDWKNWNEDSVAVGTHFRSVQILDNCEPRLVAFRHPDAFRSLVSTDIFEAKGGNDFGLIYKGLHPVSRKTSFLVMGLGGAGTEAAARFARTHAARLGALTGGAPFAAVVAPGPGQAREGGVLRWLHPRPAWWRRLLFRKSWKLLWGAVERTP